MNGTERVMSWLLSADGAATFAVLLDDVISGEVRGEIAGDLGCTVEELRLAVHCARVEEERRPAASIVNREEAS